MPCLLVVQRCRHECGCLWTSCWSTTGCKRFLVQKRPVYAMPIYRQGKHLYWAPWKGCTSMTTAPPAASGQEQTVIIDGYRPKAAAESTAWFSETLVSWGLLRASKDQRQPLQVFRYSSDDQHDICSSKTRAARQPSSVELSFAGVPLDRKENHKSESPAASKRNAGLDAATREAAPRALAHKCAQEKRSMGRRRRLQADSWRGIRPRRSGAHVMSECSLSLSIPERICRDRR